MLDEILSSGIDYIDSVQYNIYGSGKLLYNKLHSVLPIL